MDAGLVHEQQPILFSDRGEKLFGNKFPGHNLRQYSIL